MKSNLTFVKILSLVLCLALIFPSPIFADTANDYAGHWAEDSIKALYDKGFVTGYPDGTFKPKALISRAEFMAIINRAFDFNEKADISFKDVKEGEWHYEHVAKAVAAGYIKGFPDGTMRPTANISRQEAAVIIARILELEENADTSVLANIKDADKIQQWSAKGISAVISNGYIKLNKENSFEPTKPLTRAEMAFAIEKSYVKHIKRTYAQPGIFTAGNVDGSVKIDNRDVTLLNSVINGDLILGEGIGDGDVHLINVTVKGETIVRGGGENSIVIENCQFSKIVIVKEDNKVRILAKGNTKVDKVDVQSGAKLETENLTGEGFGYVTIAEGLEGDALVELIGNFESVEVRAEGVKLQVSGGKIDNLAVANTAANVEIELSEDAKVTTLQAQAPAKVTGEGKIETAQVSVSGTKIEVPVTKVEAPSGVKVDTPKPTPAPSTPSTGGSGGGGSSRRDRDDDDDDKPTRVAVTGVEINKTSLTLKVGDEYQLIADVKPSNATNKAVTWNSDNEAVATVDSTGKVTTVGKGTANITVKTNDGGYTATCEVTVEEQTPEEPEVETANFEAINEFGIHDGKIYAGYELKDSEGNQIELVASKIARIEVKNPDGKTEELTVGDDNDPYLWFNIEKEAGNYEYTVVTKGENSKTYKATLTWTEPQEAVVKFQAPNEASEVFKEAEGDNPAEVDFSKVSADKLLDWTSTKDGYYAVELKIEGVDLSAANVKKAFRVYEDGTIIEPEIKGDLDTQYVTTDWKTGKTTMYYVVGDNYSLYKAVIKVLSVTPKTEEPEEPEVETANFETINEFGIHDGKIYAGYELKDSEGKQIELVARKIERIEVKDPDGTIEELTVGDDNDPYLWFNVEKDIGQYEYTVETKEGKIYEAELDWTKEIKDATWEATKNEGEHEGVTYVEYELKDGERVSLKEGEVKLIAQKVEGKWVELTPNTDETLWFKKDKESGSYEFFVVTSKGVMYKATLNYEKVEEPEVEAANFEATGNIGIAPESAGEAAGSIYAEYKLVAGEKNISLAESNVEYIKVKVGEGKWQELTPNTDATLWFNVEAESGVRFYEVKTKDGKIYEAELDWTKEIKDATWEATKNEGEHEGVTYVEYELKDGERVSLKEGEVKLIAQKVEGKWVELTPNTDETLWFKKDKESGNYEFFVVTSEGTMYKATLLFVEPLTVTIDEITGKSNTLSGTFNKTVYLDETPLGSVDVSTKEGKIAFLNKLFNAPTDLGEYMDADKVDIELTDNSIKVTIQDGIISGEMFEAIDGDGNGVWRMDIVLNNDSFKDENGQTVEEEIEPFKIKFYVPFENNAANYDEPVKAVFQTQEQREEDEDPVVVEPLTVTIDEITGKSNTLSGTFNKTVYVDGKALGSVDVNSKEGKIAFLNKLFNAPTDLGEYMDADKVDIELTDNSIKVTIQDGIIKDGLFETLDADRDGIWRMDVVLNKENFLDENNQTVANDIEPFKIKFTSYKNQYGLGDLIDYTAESKAVFQTQAQRDAEPDKLEVTMTVEESTIAKSVVNMTTNLPIGTNLYEYPKNGLLTAFTKDGAFLLARLFKVDDDGNEQSVFFNNVFESVKIAPGPFNGIEYKANDTGRKGGDFGNTDQNGNLINNSTFLFENIRLNKSKYAGALTYNVKVDKKDFYSLWLPAGSININLNNEVKDNATSGSYVIYLEAYAPAYKDASQNLKWDDNDDLPLLEKVKVVEFTIDENASQQNMQKSHMENEKIIESEQFKELETEATIENDNLTNQKEEYEDEIDLENEENIVEEQAEDEKNMEGIDNVQENEKLMENEESDVEETEATGEQESNDGEMSADENVSSVEGDTADEVAEDEGLTDEQKEFADEIDEEKQKTEKEESFEEELVEDNDAEIEAEESANETEIADEKDIEEEQVEDETDIENADDIVEEEEEL